MNEAQPKASTLEEIKARFAELQVNIYRLLSEFVRASHSGAEPIPKCPSLANFTWKFFLQVPRHVYDHDAISPFEQKHSSKYSRSPIVQKAVVPTRLDQLRNQNSDRVLRVFAFELPDIIKDWGDYF